MERYEVRPGEGFGPFRLGMTEGEAEGLRKTLDLREPPESFYLEYLDHKLARIGLDAFSGEAAVYRDLDLFHTHAEEIIGALAEQEAFLCDCADLELASTYRFPALGLELWREWAYHPKLLENPRFMEELGHDPELLAEEQRFWYFNQVWVQTDDPRANFPLETRPAPYARELHSAPLSPPLTPEQLAYLTRKYGLEPPNIGRE